MYRVFGNTVYEENKSKNIKMRGRKKLKKKKEKRKERVNERKTGWLKERMNE